MQGVYSMVSSTLIETRGECPNQCLRGVQCYYGFAMLAASQVSGTDAVHNTAVIGDSGYAALIAILLLMSLPGIAGPLLMRGKLIAR